MNDILVHCKSSTVYFTLLSEITDGRHNEFDMLSTAYFWGAPTASWSNDQSTDIITETGDFSLRYTPSLLGRFESGIFTKISYDGFCPWQSFVLCNHFPGLPQNVDVGCGRQSMWRSVYSLCEQLCHTTKLGTVSAKKRLVPLNFVSFPES